MIYFWYNSAFYSVSRYFRLVFAPTQRGATVACDGGGDRETETPRAVAGTPSAVQESDQQVFILQTLFSPFLVCGVCVGGGGGEAKDRE